MKANDFEDPLWPLVNVLIVLVMFSPPNLAFILFFRPQRRRLGGRSLRQSLTRLSARI